MRKLSRLLLFTAGVAGLVLTFQVREATQKIVIRGQGGIVGADGEASWLAESATRRIGLWASPWYESTTFVSAHGVSSEKQKVSPVSWSSAVFCAALALLWLSARSPRVAAVPEVAPA